MAKPSSTSVPDLQILSDDLILHPGQDPSAAAAGAASASNSGSERNLVEHMARFRDSPLDFLREVSLHIYGTGWRAYDDVIGQPIFYRGFTEQMRRNVMATPMLQDKIRELAHRRAVAEDKMGIFGSETQQAQQQQAQRQTQREQELVQSLEEVTVRMTDQMICKMESKTFIRGAYYFATALLTRAYHQGIHVSSEEVLHLREVARQAAEKKQSIVFLPCHRSHIDYVSLQIICYRLGIALPTVVAGDNLGFMGVKQFLQSAGAMWIKRSFAGDALYGTLVQAYIETLLRGGFHLEAFIEGGRSRTGKLLPPKFGILSYVLDAVLSGRVDDVVICPVSTQYDKVVETESYISELLGKPKQKENLADFLNSSSILSLRLGRVDVRFHEPWSLKDFIIEQTERIQSIPRSLPDEAASAQPSQSDQTSAPKNLRVRILRALGYRVLSDINAVSVVMPTALIGTVLLTLRARGVGKTELVRRVEWLSDRVRSKGGRVAHFYGKQTSEVVDRALEVLGPNLVGTVPNLAEETFVAVDRFQLSFYRNMTIHLFVSEALLCVSVYTRVKRGGSRADQRIRYDQLYKQVAFLSRLFRSEFIFPIEGLETNIFKTLASLEADSVLQISHLKNDRPSPLSSPKFASTAADRTEEGSVNSLASPGSLQDLQNTDDLPYIELTAAERARGRENFDFYCFMIWSYVEASWLAAVSLVTLVPQLHDTRRNVGIRLSDAQATAQLLGKTLYHQGDLSYYEAVNKEVLVRSYDRFVQEGIIILTRSPDPKVPTTVRLASTWMPERDESGEILRRGPLWEFTKAIARSRREGKNRRDGATISSRVLKLADELGQALHDKAAAESTQPTTSTTPVHAIQARL